MIMYHPDLLHSNNPEYLGIKFFSIKSLSWASIGWGPCWLPGGAPEGDTAGGMCSWTLRSFRIPSLASVTGRVLVAILRTKPQRRQVGNATKRNPTSCHKIWHQSYLSLGLPLFTKWTSTSSSGKWAHVTSSHGLSKDTRNAGERASSTIQELANQGILGGCHQGKHRPRPAQIWENSGSQRPFLDSLSKVLLPREKPV